MSNQEGQEPDNAAAQAMRDLATMRGANATLRQVEKEIEVPPLTPEEIRNQFARETGLLVNDEGVIIGKVPGWKPGGAGGPDGTGITTVVPAGSLTPPPHEAQEPVTPFSVPTLPTLDNGIDLDQGVVLFEGEPYPMTEEEKGAVMLVVTNIMARETNKRIQEKLAKYKLPKPEEAQGGGTGGVPPVPPAAAPPGVPAKRPRAKRAPKVV